MIPNWNNEQRKLIKQVANLWSQGYTQEQIAESLEIPIATLRSKLLSIGVKFGRAGKLVWSINDETIDEKYFIEPAA